MHTKRQKHAPIGACTKKRITIIMAKYAHKKGQKHAPIGACTKKNNYDYGQIKN